MEERKYRVAWDGEIIAKDMRIDDALIFINALCEKYYNNRINITLLNEPRAEMSLEQEGEKNEVN